MMLRTMELEAWMGHRSVHELNWVRAGFGFRQAVEKIEGSLGMTSIADEVTFGTVYGRVCRQTAECAGLLFVSSAVDQSGTTDGTF